MKVHLATLGCRLNEAELQSWSRAFTRAGHRLAAAPEDADVVVLNSCAVTAAGARKSRQQVRQVHRANPQAKVVLTGCYASLEPQAAARLAGVDLVVDNRDKPRLPELVVERLDLRAMPEAAVDAAVGQVLPRRRTRAFVKVQDGCRNTCTYCIVRVARGAERSRSIAEVVDEVRALTAEGRREVVLTGVHLGGYGRGLGVTLADLVRAVLDGTDVARLRLGSLEPWDLPAGFFGLWADRRLAPHLHLPLQSGSDAVLRRMARQCDSAAFSALVAAAREAIGAFTVTTDVIVGFPGETDEEFADTLALVEALRFAHVHIFPYSARAGTKAARLPGQLPRAVKRERVAALHEVAARLKAAHLATRVGTSRPVLWEGEGEPLEDGRRRWEGYTDDYLRAEGVAPAAAGLRGRITPARFTAVVAGERLVAEIS